MKYVIAFVALFAAAQAAVVVHQRLGGNFAYSVNGAVPVVAPYAMPYTYVPQPAEVKEVKPVEVKAAPMVYTYPHYPYAYAPVEVKEAPKVEVKATPMVYSYAPYAPYAPYTFGYPYGYPAVLPAVSAPKVEDAKPAEPAADAEVVEA